MLQLGWTATAGEADLLPGRSVAIAVARGAADLVEELLSARSLLRRQFVTLVCGDELQRRLALGCVELAVAVLVEGAQGESLAHVELARLAAGAGRRGEGIDRHATGEVLGVDCIEEGGDAHLVVGPFTPLHVA